MDNLYRRNQILEIVRTGRPATQKELRRKLADRGIHVTQATVSRDIEGLGLVKTREGYRLPGAPEPAGQRQPGLSVILKEFLLEIRLASNLVIIKTRPGNAHTIAVGLDSTAWSELVGSVAGDDTIFLATADPRQAARLQKRILSALAGP
jgi:transcriptional regulator of arginine metabolism